MTKNQLLSILLFPFDFSMQSKKYHPDADALLEKVMNGEYSIVDIPVGPEFVVKILVGTDVVTLWIGNFPYSYGYIYELNGITCESKYGPSVIMARRFRKWLSKLRTGKNNDPLFAINTSMK